MERGSQMVGFAVGGQSFAVEIGAVREIVRLTQITPVPGAAHNIEGVMNLRGRVLPVLNLRAWLGMEGAGESRDERIVVVEIEGRRVGLHVDGEAEVLRLPFQPAQRTLEIEGKTITLLDVAQVLKQVDPAA